MLARREHSRAELVSKLQIRKFPEAEIEQALADCLREGLYSDERFTESYIRFRQNRGFGPLKISAELRERGVDEALINENMALDDPGWEQLLHQQHVKKFGEEAPCDYDEKAKRVRFLQYRGFALEKILQEL